MYDYIIIGAGPSGLTLAYELGKKGKSCLLLERQASIGGCHRVLRVDGLFTEHSPRVYLSSYLNTIELLKRMGIDFYKIFTPYKFGNSLFTERFFDTLTWSELLSITLVFILFMFDPTYGKDTSVQQFMNTYGFCASSKDFMDRFCRSTDGAGVDRFTLWQLLQVFNQNLFYGIYQPRKPNDVILLPAMKLAIEATNYVEIMLNATVQSIVMDTPTHVTGVVVNGTTFTATNIIMAVPPKDVVTLCNSNINLVNAFGTGLNTWFQNTQYNNDIAVIFHWDTKLRFKSKWGFPYSDWGLVSIVLTDYMDFNDNRSKTVISTCITYLDKPNDDNKTANEITDPNELVDIVFQQLCEMYPMLPPPTHKILSPTVYKSNGVWVNTDSAYFDSVRTKPVDALSVTVPNLFQVGVQNGQGSLHVTSFESAVSNALYFIKKHTTENIDIHSPVELRTVLWIFILIGILLLIFLYVRKRFFSTIVIDDNTEPVPFDPMIFSE